MGGFDTSINLGQILAVLATIVAFLITQRVTVATLGVRMDQLTGEIDSIREALKQVADQKARIDVIDERISAQGRRIDEVLLRRPGQSQRDRDQ